MNRKRRSAATHLAIIVLALLLAAPLAVACMTCGGEFPALVDGEFWGGG